MVGDKQVQKVYGHSFAVIEDLRYGGVRRLLFLMGHLYLIGASLGENQRTNITNTHV